MWLLFCIFWADKKLKIVPRELHGKFANTYYEILCNSCPSDGGLEHAGYNSPRYSSLRYNGPVATSQFLTEDGYLLTWHVTPVFLLPRVHPLYNTVREKIHSIIKHMSGSIFDIIDIHLHLIPDTVENVWRLSTTLLETDVISALPYMTKKHGKRYSNCQIGLCSTFIGHWRGLIGLCHCNG